MSRTYYIKSKYLDPLYIIDKLKDWRECDKTQKPDFIYYDSVYRFDKILNSYDVKVKGVINTKHTLTNKLNLYLRLKGPDFMAKTYTNPDNVPFDNKSKYILRPVEGFAGNEIYVVKTRDTLHKCMSKIRKTYKKEILISEYIRNLMLFDGRIFHLRVYFAVSIINKK